MSQRDEIARTIVEVLEAAQGTNIQTPVELGLFVADALVAAGLLVPPDMTAEKLRETAEAIDYVLGKLSKHGWTDYMEPLRGHDSQLRAWASFLDTQETAQ